MKNMTLKQIQKEFDGTVWKEKPGAYNVCFGTSKKVYTYHVSNLWALAVKLGLRTEEEMIKARNLHPVKPLTGEDDPFAKIFGHLSK